MIKLGTWRIALTFAGCFLGAGYVSGQELWQFFASFGILGYLGLILAMMLLCAFGILVMRFVSVSGITECDIIVVRKESTFFRSFVGIAEVFFLLGIAIIMSAGAGALGEQLCSVSHRVSSFVFCILVCIFSLGGVSRMVGIFSMTVPILVVCTVVISICTLMSGNLSYDIDASFSSDNPLISNFFVSALTFVAYNLFSSIGVLAPVASMTDSKKRIINGAILGTVILFLIASGIFFSLLMIPGASDVELPMLYVSALISPKVSYLYGVLLLLGMFGTALSSIVAVLEYMKKKFAFSDKRSAAVAPVLSLIIYILGLFGFGNLISVVYPIAGYLGIAAIAFIVEHYIYTIRNKKGK